MTEEVTQTPLQTLPPSLYLPTCLTLIERSLTNLDELKKITLVPYVLNPDVLTIDEWMAGLNHKHGIVEAYGGIPLSRYWTTNDLGDILHDIGAHILTRCMNLTSSRYLGPELFARHIGPYHLLVRIPTHRLSEEIDDT